MEKQLVLCASPEKQKYYFEESFKDIPVDIQEELKRAIVEIAEKVQGIISLGFYEDGRIYIEQTDLENVFADDIGAALEIKNFQKEKEELLKALRMWYMIYRTGEGKIVKEMVMMQTKGISKKEMIEQIIKKHGDQYKSFVEELIETL